MLEKIHLFQKIVGVDSYQSLEELINIKMLRQLQENVVFLTQKDVDHDNVGGELRDLLCVIT
jgi:hypothetical protein